MKTVAYLCRLCCYMSQPPNYSPETSHKPNHQHVDSNYTKVEHHCYLKKKKICIYALILNTLESKESFGQIKKLLKVPSVSTN